MRDDGHGLQPSGHRIGASRGGTRAHAERLQLAHELRCGQRLASCPGISTLEEIGREEAKPRAELLRGDGERVRTLGAGLRGKRQQHERESWYQSHSTISDDSVISATS